MTQEIREPPANLDSCRLHRTQGDALFGDLISEVR